MPAQHLDPVDYDSSAWRHAAGLRRAASRRVCQQAHRSDVGGVAEAPAAAGSQLHISGTVYPLLSMWPSYIVHLPYFSTSSFNSDPTWSALFKSHWAADWAYYNTSAYYGGDGGRYGLAAGFTDPGAVDLVPVDLVRADGPGSVKPITITIW